MHTGRENIYSTQHADQMTDNELDQDDKHCETAIKNSFGSSEYVASHRCPYAAALSASSSTSSSIIHGHDGIGENGHSMMSSSLMEIVKRSCPAFQNGACPFKDVQNQQRNQTEDNNATNEEGLVDIEAAVRQTLLKIPESHLRDPADINTIVNSDEGNENRTSSSTTSPHVFFQFIQQLHTALDAVEHTEDGNSKESNVMTPNFRLPSGCPVAKIIPLSTSTSTNRTGTNQISSSTSDSRAAVKFTEAMENCSLASIMARMAAALETDDGTFTNDIAEKDTNHILSTTTIIDKKGPQSNREISKMANESKNADDVERQSSTNAVSTTRILLSECFKTGTIESHQAAEDVHFVKNFIRGIIDADLYKELLVQLFYVYDALEGCLLPTADNGVERMSTVKCDPLEKFVPFHQRLQRKESLMEDLDYWFGSKVAADIISGGIAGNNENNSFISIACKEYVERVKQLSETDPILLLAHSYTRYLGDLSGGKVLARVAKKALNLSSSSSNGKKTVVDGLAFYDFNSTIQSAKKFKDEYKTAMDELELTTEQVVKLVNEANIAFVLNMRLFEELDVRAGVPNATVRTLESALLRYDGLHNTVTLVVDNNVKTNDMMHLNNVSTSTNTEAAAKCPFALLSSTKTTTDTTKHYSKTNFSKLNNHTQNNTNSECPFAKIGVPAQNNNNNISERSTNTIAVTTASTNKSSLTSKGNSKSGRCPWPFVLFHDPIQFVRDWQTWAILGLILSYVWYKVKTSGGGSISLFL